MAKVAVFADGGRVPVTTVTGFAPRLTPAAAGAPASGGGLVIVAGGAALVWDPKQGVVARSYLGGQPPLRHRVLDQVTILRTLRERIQLRSLT
mgnify:CR=1 FL=1